MSSGGAFLARKGPETVALEEGNTVKSTRSLGPAMSHFVDPASKDAKEVLPGIRVRAFWHERLLASFVDLAPDAVMAPHRHPEEQFGYVIRGTMHFTLDGETRTLREGDAYLIPPDVPHGVVAGSEGARVVDVFSPTPQRLKF